MKYLKEIKKFIGNSVEYDKWGGGYIWGKQNNKGNSNNNQMIAEVVKVDCPPMREDGQTPIISIRGFGAIQYLFKSREEQKEFQDELGKFIAEAINEKLNKDETRPKH